MQPDDLTARRLDAARERMASAKAAWTAAAQAVHRRDPGAQQLADAALIELNQAREELRRIDAVTT